MFIARCKNVKVTKIYWPFLWQLWQLINLMLIIPEESQPFFAIKDLDSLILQGSSDCYTKCAPPV